MMEGLRPRGEEWWAGWTEWTWPAPHGEEWWTGWTWPAHPLGGMVDGVDEVGGVDMARAPRGEMWNVGIMEYQRKRHETTRSISRFI